MAEIAAGGGGRATHRTFSDRMDRIVVGAAPAIRTLSTPVVLCAIGGYGRGTLCLHSDVDLLIVFGTRVGTEEERFLSSLLHPLWDAHLTVGYQVRTIDELEGLEDEELQDDNPELTLALQRLKTDLTDGLELERVFDHAAFWKRTLDGSDDERGES